MRTPLSALLPLQLVFLLTSCAFGPTRPCQDAGEPAREKPAEFKGTRQCSQKKDPATGKYVNDGPYIEWYPGGERALVGEFRNGKRNGKWYEYAPDGKLLSERWFENGKETLTRSKTSIPQTSPPAPTQDGDRKKAQ